MSLGMEVGLGPSDFVFDGDHASPEKKAHPHTPAHVYCGKTARWIKMPLGTEVNFGPGDVVLDGVAAAQLPTKRATAPQFSVHIYMWPKRWMEDGMEVDLGPQTTCIRRSPMQLSVKGAQQPPLFGLCLLWPRSPVSATAELLFNFGGPVLSLEQVKLEPSNFL